MRRTTVWIANVLFAVALSFFSICGAVADEVNLNSPAETAAQPITSVNLLFDARDGRKLNLIMYGVREGQKEALKNALEGHYGSQPLKLVDTVFTDAEKYDNEPERKIDNGYCWAGSISNMLWNSGWAKNYVNPQTGNKFASEDEVFAYYFFKVQQLRSREYRGGGGLVFYGRILQSDLFPGGDADKRQ